jgi:mono/diheme cytochrome c family protein
MSGATKTIKTFQPQRPPRSLSFFFFVCLVTVMANTVSVPLTAQTPPTGNSTRGKTLFDTTYRCYACHGYDGQTGSPRLVPMAMNEGAFVALLRKPPSQAMPKFVDVPQQDLADVYAYVRSIRVAAPAVDSIPALKDARDRRAQATQRDVARPAPAGSTEK